MLLRGLGLSAALSLRDSLLDGSDTRQTTELSIETSDDELLNAAAAGNIAHLTEQRAQWSGLLRTGAGSSQGTLMTLCVSVLADTGDA
jgi:hypothetical protein